MRALAFALLLVVAARPAAAAEEGGVAQLLWQAFNLALLIGVIVYFARQPVRDFLAARRERIRDDLDGSARLLAAAETRLAEWSERASRLEGELDEIRETSRRLAREEREEILDQARAGAERIRRDAEAAVEQEVRRAREDLAAEAGELAVELAGRILREHVSAADQRRLFDEFLERIESLDEPPTGSGR